MKARGDVTFRKESRTPAQVLDQCAVVIPPCALQGLTGALRLPRRCEPPRAWGFFTDWSSQRTHASNLADPLLALACSRRPPRDASPAPRAPVLAVEGLSADVNPQACLARRETAIATPAAHWHHKAGLRISAILELGRVWLIENEGPSCMLTHA